MFLYECKWISEISRLMANDEPSCQRVAAARKKSPPRSGSLATSREASEASEEARNALTTAAAVDSGRLLAADGAMLLTTILPFADIDFWKSQEGT